MVWIKEILLEMAGFLSIIAPYIAERAAGS
jgi:hypothetical protein